MLFDQLKKTGSDLHNQALQTRLVVCFERCSEKNTSTKTFNLNLRYESFLFVVCSNLNN